MEVKMEVKKEFNSLRKAHNSPFNSLRKAHNSLMLNQRV
jgi:hypothetical protein